MIDACWSVLLILLLVTCPIVVRALNGEDAIDAEPMVSEQDTTDVDRAVVGVLCIVPRVPKIPIEPKQKTGNDIRQQYRTWVDNARLVDECMQRRRRIS